jgi:hypothetical protein
MPVVISLSEFIDAIESATDEADSYLDPDSGEIAYVTDEMRDLAQEGEDEHTPDWMRGDLPKVREALESGRFLSLPTEFHVHEWAIMEEFSQDQENDRVRGALLDAIHGSGAFRMFKSTVRRLGIEKDWYKFRDEAIKQIAVEWLEEHHLQYK